MATIISMGDYMVTKRQIDSVKIYEAERMRDRAAQVGRMLIWHAEHSPLSAWAAAIPANNLDGNCALLHALHNSRPKRQATAEEVREIKRLLCKRQGEAPRALVDMLADDPDWHLFALALAIEPRATGDADDDVI